MPEMSTKQELYFAHVEEWTDCKKCPLGLHCHKHVLYWESMNLIHQGRADILLIGEGPGAAEDATGIPFFGPSGRPLRTTLDKARIDGMIYGISNTIACRPTTEDGRNRPPEMSEIKACFDRVVSLIKIVKPKSIVYVGAVASGMSETYKNAADFKGRTYHVYHPSYILRSGGLKSEKYPAYLLKFKQIFKETRRMR